MQDLTAEEPQEGLTEILVLTPDVPRNITNVTATPEDWMKLEDFRPDLIDDLKCCPPEQNLLEFIAGHPLENPCGDEAYRLAYAPIIRDLPPEIYKEGALLFAAYRPPKWKENVPGIQQADLMQDLVLREWILRTLNEQLFHPIAMQISAVDIVEAVKLRFNEYKRLHRHPDAPKTPRSRNQTGTDRSPTPGNRSP